MKIKLIAVILFVTLLFTPFYFSPAQAQWATFDAPTEISTLSTTIGTWGDWFGKIAQTAMAALSTQALLFNKIAALLAVQKATSLIIGDGNDGTIIRDFNNYLYVSPQQRAMAQMNSFFNTVSRGRLSTLNYEGVGPNYDAYLVAQARQAIAGQSFSTNLQDVVTDPSQMFAGGNMKGLMTYMQCANNVACYTLTSAAQYNLEFAKAQEIAKNENVNGFIPKKTNGRIVQPAAIAQNALLQLDQLGTQVIMNAQGGTDEENVTAIQQVWMGAGISATARLTNYGVSDKAGRDAIRNKNDQFPFSLAYSANSGVGISAGGVTASTGVGALSGAAQIGNTCATGNFSVNAQGVATDIHGTKIQCPAGSKPKATGTAPSANVNLPKAN